jgi:hypothetical protein
VLLVVHQPPVADVEQNPPVRHVRIHPNDDIVDLQNSLRTFRLSNDGLSMLLERTQTQLEDSNAKVTETQRRLQFAEMALQVQTEENLAHVQLQGVLNQNLQVVTGERDDAIIQKPLKDFKLRLNNML